ncbi:unnamed protein product [Caenorhabditis brenneri]
MTRVPRNCDQLEKWCQILGKDFTERVAKMKSRPFICRSHFLGGPHRRGELECPQPDNRTFDRDPTEQEEESDADNHMELDISDDGDLNEIRDREGLEVIEKTDGDVGILEDETDMIQETFDDEYIPNDDEEKDAEDDVEMNCKEKRIEYVLVDHSILLQSLLYCRTCHSDKVNIEKEVATGACITRGALNLSGDAQWDSPGFCAENCQYVLLDADTSLVVDAHHEKKESSKSLEPKCMQLALSHFIETVEKTERNVSKETQKQMIPARKWIDGIKNHLYWSIQTAKGDGAAAVDYFLSFFLHAQGVHRNFKKVGSHTFTKVFKCSHGRIKKSDKQFDLRNSGDELAWKILLEIATEPRRLKDLKNVSPMFATSQVESFNNVSLIYHPKHLFFQPTGFKMRVKLSVIHWNSLKIDDRAGIRKKIGVRAHFNKTLKRETFTDLLSPGTHKWRRRILEEVRNHKSKEEHEMGLENEELLQEESIFYRTDELDMDAETDVNSEYSVELNESFDSSV